MGLVTGIIVFLLIWWVSLFAVLPFGHAREVDGTPVKANLKRKFIWTTLVAMVVWGIVFVLIEAEIVSFREIANEMALEDKLR
ncbi:MAG TPA: DUF1467 family protein [Alphaproteobacteria bacterium]|mgnify:CR=1 FL=1|nr:DUF1467 family protein [Alphaproteobacteria bacterium]USO06125.1 MAG: DUF1467 family protein [Rhodospirillales bacterium]HOO82077.1 DUF1467 family protein [Alphaproteobacteria bacterium]